MTEKSQKKYSPEQLALYYSPTCPYCLRVFNVLDELGYTPDLAGAGAGGIALRDKTANQQFAQDLLTGGGKKTVPCLRIEHNGEVKWQYESLDIIAFLQDNFA